MQTLKNAIAAYGLDMKGVGTYNAQFAAQFGTTNTTGVPNYLRDLIIQPSFDSQGLQPVQSFNPQTRLGWRGPYLAGWTGTFTNSPGNSFAPYYVSPTDPAQLDGWGNPIVLQWPAASTVSSFSPPLSQYQQIALLAQNVRLVSAGPSNQNVYAITANSNGWLTPMELLPSYRGTNLVVFLNVPDPYVSNLFPQR